MASPSTVDPVPSACIACKKVPESNKQLSKCGKCAHALYCSRECQVQHWDLHKSTCSPLIRLVQSPLGAGSGLVAACAIPRGTVVLRDVPIMMCPTSHAATSLEEAEAMHERNVDRLFSKLHPKKQRAFMDLMSWDKYDDEEGNPTVIGLFQTNSLQIADKDNTNNTSAVFLGMCRTNHSCRPNVHHYWRVDLQQLVLTTTRDLQAGEELFLLYGPSECMDTAGRRLHLKTEFGFECQCPMCKEQGNGGAGDEGRGDERMREINQRCADVQGQVAAGAHQKALDSIDVCLTLMAEQGIGDGILTKPLFTMGYQVALMGLKNKRLAKAYLQKETALVELYEGLDSPGALQCRHQMQQLSNGRRARR